MSTAVVRAVEQQTWVDPIALVREALADAGMNYISFVVEFPGGGRVVLHLIELGPAVEVTPGGMGLGSLVLVEGAVPELRGGGLRGEMPTVARVNRGALRSIEAAANPDLEVLSIGVWEGDPLSLAPVADLPRLRTLRARPGTLADLLEIAGLTRLECLALGPEEWRVLLDAGAVPRTLSAAAVDSHGGRNPLSLVAISN
jgi:hypothetical protein